MPQVELEAIALTRLVAEVQPEKVEEAIQNCARRGRSSSALAEPRPAADGDQVVIDFEGRIDGEPSRAAPPTTCRCAWAAKGMIPASRSS